jgi:hypothetical protein
VVVEDTEASAHGVRLGSATNHIRGMRL